jgi:hypothetical protein
MGKKSGSGFNNPDHISESLKTIFGVKLLKFSDADPGSGMEKVRIRDNHFGSATLESKETKMSTDIIYFIPLSCFESPFFELRGYASK